MTAEVYAQVKDVLPELPARPLALKGFDAPVDSYVIGERVLTAELLQAD